MNIISQRVSVLSGEICVRLCVCVCASGEELGAKQRSDERAACYLSVYAVEPS